MGYKFGLRDANIVAYLTRPTDEDPPRLTGKEAIRFLLGFAHAEDSLISSDPKWVDRISRIARDSYHRFNKSEDSRSPDFLKGSVSKVLFSELRAAFQEYDLYILPTGVDVDPRMNAWAHHVAYSSEHHCLVLMPSGMTGVDTFDIFDPMPPFKAIADNPENWPGVLFWVKAGEAAFAPASQAEELFTRLSRDINHGEMALCAIIRDYNSAAGKRRPNQILQLSDLHFGTRDALEHEAYLETCLDHMAPTLDRVVITGDVFDSPKDEDYAAFDRFYTALTRNSAKDPILVPGNHDQRMYGNRAGRIGEDTRFLAKMDFSPGVVIDDDLRCIFLRFNSSEGGDFARGEISNGQRRMVATRLMNEQKRRPHVEEYSRIALVHHHPLPYAPEEARPIHRGVKGWFVGNEKFIEMLDAPSFLKWCARRDVPLILHGHKHLPRHRREEIFEDGTLLREITTVGCGASLGKGSSRLSYNIIAWHPEAERWVARFFSGPLDGSGFQEDFVTLYKGAQESRAS